MKIETLLRLIGIRSEDKRKFWMMAPVFFCGGLAEMLNYNGFMTLFNKRFGIEYLPYVYTAEAIILPLEAWFMSWLTNRLSKPAMMRALYSIMTGIVLVNSLILLGIKVSGIDMRYYYPVLFLSSNFVVRQLTILLWSLAIDLCPTQQAKRLMPLFVSSSTIGGMIAGIVVQLVSSTFGAEIVYAMAPLFLLLGYVNYKKAIDRYLVPLTLKEEKRGAEASVGLTSGQYFIQSFKSPFLLCAIGLMTAMPALYFLNEYQYMTVAKIHYPDEDALGSYFGLITMLLFAAAFGLQFISGKLMGWLGASNMLVAISAVYIGGFMLVALTIGSGFALPGVSISYMFIYLLLYYFAEPAYQLFFKMLPLAQRDGFRYMAQGIATSVGILLGAHLQLIHSGGLTGLAMQAVVGLSGTLLLIALAWYGRRLYLRQLVASIQALHFAEHEMAASFDGLLKNGKMRAAVAELLRHSNAYAREVAIEIIGRAGDRSFLPQLLTLSDDASARVRIAALRAMNLEEADLMALVKVASFLEDPDFEVRAEGVKRIARAVHMQHQANYFVRLKLLDTHPRVVAEAVKALYSLGNEASFEACYESIDRQLDAGGEAAVHICDVVAELEMYSFVDKVERLIEDRHPAVRVAAVRCLGVLRHTAAIPRLVGLLPIADPELLRATTASFAQMGAAAVTPLSAVVADQTGVHPKAWSAAMTALSAVLSEEEVKARLVDSCASKLASLLRERELQGALLRMGQEELAKLAELRLKEIREAIFDAAWSVLGRLADEHVVASVRQAVFDEHEETRGNGLEVLAEGLGDRRLAGMLLAVIERWDERNSVDNGDAAVETVSLYAKEASDHWLSEIAASAEERWGRGEMQEQRGELGMLDKVVFLKQVSFFSDLSLEELGLIAGIAEEQVHPDQSVLVHKGEENTAMYVLIDGNVELSSVTSSGAEGTIGVLGPNDVFGETSALDGTPSSVTAQALFGEARLLALRGEEIARLIRLYPEIGLSLLRASYARVRRLEEMVMRMGM